jgi:3-oxoacyl-[acyl-carrier-protein] synthase II
VAEPRVVVTGLGAVTPVGHDVENTWSAFVEGRSGVAATTLFDPAAYGLASRVAAEVKDWEPTAYFDKRAARRMDRVMQFARLAAREALGDAGLLAPAAEGEELELDVAQARPERVGVFVGSGLGGVGTLLGEEATLHAKGGNRVSPFLIPMILADSIPGAVAIAHGLKGPNLAHLSACASGANAIGEAFEAIRRGSADVMVAGGSEASIVPVVAAGFENMGALTTYGGDASLASRPFDKERDGFVIGEGAGVLVLERRDHALARGATVYCELVGYGSTADAEHVTAPAADGDGIVRAMSDAVEEARIPVESIAYVNAHGTSTPLNDAVETVALHRFLGRWAPNVPVSSVKSMIGHLLGAGGAVEAVATAKTIHSGVIPPTINLNTPDPACDLDYVPHTSRRPAGGVPVAMSTSLGFGGHNAALLFARH